MAHETNEDSITGINMTPLVDIALVLLIIFMVTTTINVNPSIKVDLPKSKSTDLNEEQRVSITITKQLEYFYDGKRSSSDLILENIRQRIQQKQTNFQVLIISDKSVAVEHIIQLMDGIKRMGMVKIGVQVDKQ